MFTKCVYAAEGNPNIYDVVCEKPEFSNMQYSTRLLRGWIVLRTYDADVRFVFGLLPGYVFWHDAQCSRFL